jgi:two-component system response regulator AtoC
MQRFMNYGWPGNVRELENVIERCMALADVNAITCKHLPIEIHQGAGIQDFDFGEAGLSVKKNRAKLEKMLISQALVDFGGNKTKASAALELSIPALLYKIKEYQLDGAS